jgi:hypothetical protein
LVSKWVEESIRLNFEIQNGKILDTVMGGQMCVRQKVNINGKKRVQLPKKNLNILISRDFCF